MCERTSGASVTLVPSLLVRFTLTCANEVIQSSAPNILRLAFCTLESVQSLGFMSAELQPPAESTCKEQTVVRFTSMCNAAPCAGIFHVPHSPKEPKSTPEGLPRHIALACIDNLEPHFTRTPQQIRIFISSLVRRRALRA